MASKIAITIAKTHAITELSYGSISEAEPRSFPRRPITFPTGSA